MHLSHSTKEMNQYNLVYNLSRMWNIKEILLIENVEIML